MSPAVIFNLHLILGYVAWLMCTTLYICLRFGAMSPVNAQRAIAMLHSFRFFGLVFILPGVVGHGLPADLRARSPRTAILQPVCWRSWRFSREKYVHSFGRLSSASTLWERSDISLTTITEWNWVCPPFLEIWARPTRS